MVESDQDQKTEEATSKRLEEAREEGKVPVSREMATLILFLGILVVVMWLAPLMGQQMVSALRVFLEMPHAISLEGPDFQTAMAGALAKIALASVLVFGILAFAAVVGTMIQTGFYVNTSRLKFDVEHLMPGRNFGQIFSMNGVAELLKSIIKLIIVGGVVVLLFRPIMREAPSYAMRDLLDGMIYMHKQAVHLIVILVLIVTVMAVADLLYQRFQYFKGLRMTKQEIKDEHKQMEGDPLIRSRLRQIRMEKARKRMMANVPKADVIVTNPTHYAVALKYDNAKMAAPTVIAKGVDQVAGRIRDVAEENGIPLVSNPPLARALYDTVDLDEVITPQHYRAVAEVISYVYKLKKKI